jgi:hypothetical protein
MLPGIGGRQLAARYGGGWLARALGYGAEGAALGAAQGAGNTYTGKPLDYLTNAGIGGGVGGVLGAGMGSVFAPRGGMRSSAETPSTNELFAAKNADYVNLNQQPRMYEPSYLGQAADIAENTMRLDRQHPNTSPRSFNALDEMRGAPTAFPTGQAPVAPGDIDFIRKGITKFNPVTEATDKFSSGYVKRALDDFMRNPPPGAVMPGMEAAAADASAIANRAHGNYAGYKRGQFWDDLMSNAQDTAGATHSGLNLQNELRKGVRSAIRQREGVSPASRAGFNQDEIGAFRDFDRGNFGTNLLRGTSAALGGGGGIGIPLAAGIYGTLGAGGSFLSGDPTWSGTLGVLAPVAGLGLRHWGNQRAMNEITNLGNMIRQRTPLYQERAATAPMVTPPGGQGTQRARDAITLELLRQQQGDSSNAP